MKSVRLSLLVLFTLTVSLPASAAIISGAVTGGSAQTAGGVFVKLAVPLQNPFGPPSSVGDDNFQSPNLFAFDEQQNIVLAAPLIVDQGTSPVPAGTIVSSYYVFFDPGPSERMIGTVNFDSDVLGILTSADTLAGGDFLANPNVTYLNASSRGLEAGDSVTISGPRQILFDTVASSPGDYVRVLTVGVAAVPEPAEFAMVGLTLAALALLRQTRSKPRRAN